MSSIDTDDTLHKEFLFDSYCKPTRQFAVWIQGRNTKLPDVRVMELSGQSYITFLFWVSDRTTCNEQDDIKRALSRVLYLCGDTYIQRQEVVV